MDKPKGRFTADWWVACGKCADHQPLDVRSYGGDKPKAARKIGFVYHKTLGWICPRCRERLKESA